MGLDFGLVKVLRDDAEQITQEGEFLGSPKYMAPEQIAHTDVDARTDLYSLGALIYLMCTGQPPFVRDNSMNRLLAHLNDPVPPMSEHDVDVPVELEQVALRCLAKSPGDRYESESSDIGPGTSEPTPNQAVVPSQGRDVAELIEWVCERFGVSAESLRAGRRLRNVARARAVVAYLAVIEGSASTTDVARALGVSPSAISRVLDSGRRLAESEGLARRCADPRCEAHRTDGNPPAGRISQ